MRKVLLQLFFALTLLGSSPYSLYAEETQLQTLPQEIQEVVASSKTYLFIGEELTQIKSIITQARALAEDTNSAQSVDQLINRYEQGLKTAPQDLVIAALEEAELLIEKGHEVFSDEELTQISDDFAKCCKQIDNDELLISVNKNNTRSPRDPQTPGGGTSAPAPEAGTLVPIDVPSKDLFVENDLTVGGNMDIHGDTHYAGNVDIDGSLTVGLATTLTGIVYPIASIEAGPSGILNIGVTTDTDTINVGNAGDTINIVGTTTHTGNVAIVGSVDIDDVLHPEGGIEANPSGTGILNIGITDDTDTLNLGTADTDQTINIGTGSATKTVNIGTEGTTIINVGNTGDTINITGSTLHTGDIDLAGRLYARTGIEAKATPTGSGTLNIGVTDDTNTLNLGRGSGVHLINIGSDNDTVNIYGDINYVQVDDLQVHDKNITINKDGGAGTADRAGINIEEDGDNEAGYIRTNLTRDGFELKAPARDGVVTIKPTDSADQFQLLIGTERLFTERTWRNMFIGRNAGNLNFAPTPTTGSANYGVGYQTLLSLTTGSGNVGIGHVALQDVTEGSNNVCIGREAGNDIISGSSNVAIGNLSLRSAETANYNTAIGAEALKLAYDGENSALGSRALQALSYGSFNTGIGNEALLNLESGFRNTALGYLSGANITTARNNNIYIGSCEKGTLLDEGVTRIGSWNNAYDTSLTTACYIQGINGQSTADSSSIVLNDATGKLGTTAATSATVHTPNLTISSTSGAAVLALHDGSGTPVTWSLNAASSTTNLEMRQDETIRLQLNKDTGIRLSDVRLRTINQRANGYVPIIIKDSITVCPRIVYGRVTEWDLISEQMRPLIDGCGWLPDQPQGTDTTIASFWFEVPFTQVPTCSVEANTSQASYAVIDEITTSNIKVRFKDEGGAFVNRITRFPHIIVIGY